MNKTGDRRYGVLAQRTPHRTPICAAIVVALGAAPLAAMAQQSSEPKDEGRSSNRLEQVVITSQKRAEKLKDTPVAASVVSTDALDKSNASDVTDINKIVPSVQLKGTFNGRVPLAMRGISTNANEAAIGLTSGVSLMIDGVPVPSDSMAANELQDIRRVEVLKGPQSTLGGRTASAGVINFVTQTPTQRLTGNLGLTLSDDKERRVNAFVSGPINEMLAFSVSAYRNEREYPIRNLLLGENSRTESSGARAKLQLRPDSTLDITLTAREAKSDSTGGTFTYQYVTPGDYLFSHFPWTPGIAQSVALPGINVRYGNMDYASPVHMVSKVRDSDVSLNIEKRFGDGFTFTSTTASQREKQNIVQDVPAVAVYFLNDLRAPAIPTPENGGPPYYDNSQTIYMRPKSLSQEFKIASPLDQAVSYVAGVFYSDVQVDQDHNRMMFVNPKVDTVNSTSKTLGVYGRATWKLSEDYSLLTGLRYNRDQLSYSIVDHARSLSSAASDTSTATVGDLTLRRKLDENHMVYATYARGYKPRAYNTAQTLGSNDALKPVEKEKINHIELGSKSTLLGGALTLNAALFNTEYKDYQVQIYEGTTVIADLVLSNAGKARTRGLELDAVMAVGERARVSASAAFIDARFVSYTGAPCWPGQTSGEGCTVSASTGKNVQDLSGKTMPDSPKFKLTLSGDYDLEQSVIPWDLRLNAQYSYRGKALMQADQNPKTLQPAFGILNLGVTASSPDARHTLTLFCNNVTNRFYLVNAEDFWGSLWGDKTNAVIGQPARDAQRYFGVRYNLAFN